ncbi:MAG: hypothetical protein ABIF77_14460 [bacterium]
MLITKRSRKRSDKFQSRFEAGESSFPIRQYLRCREEMISGVIHAVLMLCFLVTLVFFAKTLDNFFQAHADTINPFYRWVSLAVLIGMMLLVVRRIWNKIRDTRQAREEMQELAQQVPDLKRLRR